MSFKGFCYWKSFVVASDIFHVIVHTLSKVAMCYLCNFLKQFFCILLDRQHCINSNCNYNVARLLVPGIIKLCQVTIMLQIWHLVFMHFLIPVNAGAVEIHDFTKICMMLSSCTYAY